MKTLVTAMAALLLTAGAAAAAQPLTEAQLDSVSAGNNFTANASADANGLVGPFQWVATQTETTAQVQQLPWAHAWVSYSASSSSTFTGRL